MESYIGAKIIKATSMTDMEFEYERSIYQDAKIKVNDYKNGLSLIGTGSNGCSPCTPREPQEGYKVRYPDGYTSWSPKNVFEESYRPISRLEKDLI